MSSENQNTPLFTDLGLSQPLLKALDEAGYESPTPIQVRMIPPMLEGRDVVGQAQTGTGKTAAFALPLLMHLRPGKVVTPQILVLAPTRELAIQVAESFQQYGKHLPNFRALPIFGGQDYTIQLNALKRGAQVIVGTPGRVMDHIRRGSLNLASIHCLVLDEADEMLKMGFIDDVEWILEQTPAERQVALFSATMPQSIRLIAQKHLSSPVSITIETRTATAQTINQRYLSVNGFGKKLEALSRLLESEPFNAMLVFVRTKLQTVELAESLAELGYNCAPLSGDIQQSNRLRTIEQLKNGKIDILVATDVAARGLDVERISHVINFDIPFDNEAYIHRIGRTGRAGRSGEAILFVHPREQRMLTAIEKLTRQKITPMVLPSTKAVNAKRIERFKERITSAINADSTVPDIFQKLVSDYQQEHQVEPLSMAAALARLLQGSTPLLLPETIEKKGRAERTEAIRPERRGVQDREPKGRSARSAITLPGDEAMDRYRIEIGHNHGVKPGNIVGAIANEADLSSANIGRISIFDDYSTVDLPFGMPNDIFRLLQKVRINDRSLRISKLDEAGQSGGRKDRQAGKAKSGFAAKSTRPRSKGPSAKAADQQYQA
jgi:ATP-dependent RNA helicase DeaD